MKDPEYDEATCVTAGDLRAMGIQLPENIPDCGWVHRDALEISSTSVGPPLPSPDGKITIDVVMKLTKPFRWIELDLVVEKPGGVDNC